jgi:hypothetical protein
LIRSLSPIPFYDAKGRLARDLARLRMAETRAACAFSGAGMNDGSELKFSLRGLFEQFFHEAKGG